MPISEVNPSWGFTLPNSSADGADEHLHLVLRKLQQKVDQGKAKATPSVKRLRRVHL